MQKVEYECHFYCFGNDLVVISWSVFAFQYFNSILKMQEKEIDWKKSRKKYKNKKEKKEKGTRVVWGLDFYPLLD